MIAWLTVISALTALLAVVVGPLVTVYVTRRRLRFEAIVLQRTEVIREMRRLFAEFISYLMVTNSERGMGRISHAAATEKLEKAFRLETELSLILDARIDDHRTVLLNITEARNRVFRDMDDTYNPTAWQPHYEQAIKALVRILRAEEENVRQLR
jgi:hypothetical protein